jgi:hypothetical protein
MRSQHTPPTRIHCTMVSATLRRRLPVHMIGGPCIAVTALPSFDSSDTRASVPWGLLLGARDNWRCSHTGSARGSAPASPPPLRAPAGDGRPAFSKALRTLGTWNRQPENPISPASLFRFGRALPVTIATRIMCMASRLCRTRGVAFSLAAVESGLRDSVSVLAGIPQAGD